MIKTTVIIISFLFAFCFSAKAGKDSLIIKFTSENAIPSNEQAAILESILGGNESRNLISKNTLNVLRINKNLIFFIPQYNHYDNLSRIYNYVYNSGIVPFKAAKYISKLDFVEYAEPFPERHLVELPDDSLASIQYHLSSIRATDAWDFLPEEGTVIVGVVDTGIDYEHEDLAGNIFINPGESGEDGNGKDKRSNGIDDDNNGYVDDWRGWDFVSQESSGFDNDPLPGHEHGTHVGGIIAAIINNKTGIAGVAKRVKLLPVKISADSPWSRSVENSYEGVLYAAIAGADVINCSWGGTASSFAEEEIINAALDMGSVIVAAAGNDGSDTRFYPASYKGVLSVAAIDVDNKKAFYSNYNSTIDVSAPGSEILSTIPGNEYKLLSGTSMASPVAAGVAAMVRLKFPDYSNEEVIEHVKATTFNLDSLSSLYYKWKIGTGKVDAFMALSSLNAKSALIENVIFTDKNEDGLFEDGEEATLEFEIRNILSDLSNSWIKIIPVEGYLKQMSSDSIFIGILPRGKIFKLEELILFNVPSSAPLDYILDLRIEIYDNGESVGRQIVSQTIRPSFRTLKENDLSVTLNSRGNIAYNDYPNNEQGEGFRYKQSDDLLFEGSLIVGMDGFISNVARGSAQLRQNLDFKAQRPVLLDSNIIDGIKAVSFYGDDKDSIDAKVDIYQHSYQFRDEDGFLFCVYDIINRSGGDTDSLFAALYFDWDIGPSARDNRIYLDNESGIGICESTGTDTVPVIGAVMLSAHPLNFWGMDNGGQSDDNPGVWDGFTTKEKWQVISSGIGRSQSSITDASMIIGAGPVSLDDGDTTRVAFAFCAAPDKAALLSTAGRAREVAELNDLNNGKFVQLPQAKIEVYALYPNPAVAANITVEFGIEGTEILNLEIVDFAGKVRSYKRNKEYRAGNYKEKLGISKLAQGAYLLVLRGKNHKISVPFIIQKP